ncbi:unnamed protein product [Prunus armeniaca]|uniref:Uncharacterized protein n=1 Tax=Prunus armeniaca TaxID=36596 RepID=A0A6J5WD85_PRUAR|nr:unnamed protein product [Prunus armeniaca]
MSSQTARGACSPKKKNKAAHGVVDPQKDLLSHLINPKWPTVKGPKTISKRKKQELEEMEGIAKVHQLM